MRCVIVQPSYIPWRGYFDLIRRADVFVFYDDVQYDARGWRNRNRIKTPEGARWLTIPVAKHGAQTEGIPINAIATVDDGWAVRHRRTLAHAYARAPYFAGYRNMLDRLYAAPAPLLADFTIRTTIEISTELGLTDTEFLRSSTLPATGRKTERLVSILATLGATRYLSGPSAKAYIDAKAFDEAGIALEWMSYDYPEYPQLYPPFDPQVSILDLLFMTGRNALRYMVP
jgi:hypothetical protein